MATFSKKQFVISRTEPARKKLSAAIKRNGGSVAERLSKRTDYFLQSYNAATDDGRLASARRVGAFVVSGAFVFACVERGRCLQFEEFALGLQPWSALRVAEAKLLQKFSPPLPEWREQDEELPQGFQEFLENKERLRATEGGPKLLCVLPLQVERTSGSKAAKRRRTMTPPNSSLLHVVTDYLTAFFGLEVRVLDPCSLQQHSTSAIILPSKRKVKVAGSKLSALDLIDYLVEDVLPAQPEGFLALAVTAEEIYDSDPDVVIYGRAMGDGGCVLTLSCVGEEQEVSRVRPAALRTLLGSASHELLHCLGIDHCAFFGCLLNACCDADAEAPDASPPLFLCPVDLRKLQVALRLSDAAFGLRFDRLERFFRGVRFEEEAKRARELRGCFV